MIQVTILPFSVKGNQDGSIALKLAPGADRIELTKLEGKLLNVDIHCDKALVIPEERFILLNLLDEIQKIEACVRTMIDRQDEKEDSEKLFVEAPECEGCERKGEFEKKIQATIEKAAEEMPEGGHDETD